MSESLTMFVLSLAALTAVVSAGLAALNFRKWRGAVLIGGALLLGVGGTTVDARPRPHAAPLKFEIKAVESVTGKRKAKFFLGETVSIVFTLTNLGRNARTITELQDTGIKVKLISLFTDEDTPDTYENVRGGTDSYSYRNGVTYGSHREPRKVTLSPGKSVSVTIDDLGRFFNRRLQDGNHTFTAIYNYSLRATSSFRIVIDEAKSVPVLEAMAEAPVTNGDDTDRIWANAYLREIRRPSISGRITDADGKPLGRVWIDVTGTEKTNIETRSNGRYHLTQMTQGGTSTLTPSIRYSGPGEASYTFDPPSRTVTNLNSHLADVDFKATRVRLSTNVASAHEGAKATASSMGSEYDYSVESVIDDFRDSDGWGGGNGGWSDGTPNVFPDWIEVNWGSAKAIDWINVFTLQDDYANHPAEPDLKETFSKYGITDFDVQYWNGRVWKNVPRGAIRGNRNVWRKIDFPRITTNKIRVLVRNALDGHSRITEIEAFHVNDLPQVKFLDKQSGMTGSSVQFRTQAVDIDGAIRYYHLDFGDRSADYEWNFSDKTGDKGPKLTHTHTYEHAGTYTVTLKATDNNDEPSVITTKVTITDPAWPSVANAGGPYDGIAGGDVSFKGRASSDPDGSIFRYRWNFGDGTIGKGATALHKYAKPGTHEVTLLVTDNDGQTASATALVRITAPPPKLGAEMVRQRALR